MLAKHATLTTPAAQTELKYTHAVLQETMRMTYAVGAVPRAATLPITTPAKAAELPGKCPFMVSMLRGVRYGIFWGGGSLQLDTSPPGKQLSCPASVCTINGHVPSHAQIDVMCGMHRLPHVCHIASKWLQPSGLLGWRV